MKRPPKKADFMFAVVVAVASVLLLWVFLFSR